jgi:hypothetical protein
MVGEGQYLERATVIPGSAGALEGLFHRGRRWPGVVIAPPTPGAGGGMEGPVVAELAWAITRAGHPTLRFNYRGVGASAGSFDEAAIDLDLDAAESHLSATLAELAATTARPGAGALASGLGLCGSGRGGDLVLRRAAAHPERYAAVVAVLPTGDAAPDLSAVEAPCVVIVPQHHGRDLSAVRAAVEAAPGGRWVSIPRADPGFLRGLVDAGRAAAEVFGPSDGLVPDA